MTAAGIKPVGVPEIKKQLLFAEAISLTSGKKKKRIKRKVSALYYLEKY